MEKAAIIKNGKLAIGIASAMIGGYATRVQAGSCPGAAGTYTCSGAATGIDIAQLFLTTAPTNLTVTTNAGFGLTSADAGASAALVMAVTNGKGSADLSFIDNNNAIITGAQRGINAFNQTLGNISITTTGDITGTTSIGIQTSNSKGSGTTDITTTGEVNGRFAAVVAYNYGSNSTTITTTGRLTSTVGGVGGVGIFVRNADSATDLIIDVNNVIDAGRGISTENGGIGETSITQLGDIINSTIGVATIGASTSTSMNIDIQGNIIDAQTIGVASYHYGTSLSQTITVSGNISATDTGISTLTDEYAVGNVGNSIITLNLGATVSATVAIQNGTGASDITINTGAAVAGAFNLGDGSDNVNFAGGDFSGVTLLDGGDDFDTADGFTDELTFSGSNGFILANNIVNWERVVLDNGSQIDFSDGAAVVLNTGVLDNLGGTVNMVNAAPTDALNVSGDYGGGGSLALEVELNVAGLSDTLIIGGDTLGTTTVTVSNVGGAGAQTVGNGMLLIQVGGASNGTFTLSAPIRAGDYLYELIKEVDGNWYLQSHFAPINIPTLSEWGQILLVSLLGLFGLFGSNLRTKRNRS